LALKKSITAISTLEKAGKNLAIEIRAHVDKQILLKTVHINILYFCTPCAENSVYTLFYALLSPNLLTS